MRWDGSNGDQVDLGVPGATANNDRFTFAANGDLSVRSLTIRGGADLAEPFQMSEEKIPEGSVKFAEIAFDADYEYFQLNGGSVAATTADIESIINAVDDIYLCEVGIAYHVTTIVVAPGEGGRQSRAIQMRHRG
jgi:hypothetical protein